LEAFSSCTNIASLTLGSAVTNIGQKAFQNCKSLTSVTIPSSVASIGIDAFNLCANLTSVTFQGTVQSTYTSGLSVGAFTGDLYFKFYSLALVDGSAPNGTNGTPGTYTTTAPVDYSSVWTRR